MEVIDMNAPPEERRLKALVYGKSGTGKTSFGVTAPRPLILLNELQARPHIRAAALRLGIPQPSVLRMQSVQDYRNVIRALHGDRSKPFVVRKDDGAVAFESAWPLSVVLDSLTEACELVSEEIREQAPPKLGKDGLPVDSERYWNVFADRAQKLIRAFRDVDMNTLFLCQLDDRTTGEGDAAVRSVGPSLTMRKLPSVVMAAVNVVGVTYRAPGKVAGESTYGIRTSGPEYVELKPFPPLRPHEVTDFSSWCSRVNGTDDGKAAPPPPADEPPAPPAAPAEKTAAPPEVAPDARTADQPAPPTEVAPEKPAPAKSPKKEKL